MRGGSETLEKRPKATLPFRVGQDESTTYLSGNILSQDKDLGGPRTVRKCLDSHRTRDRHFY